MFKKYSSDHPLIMSLAWPAGGSLGGRCEGAGTGGHTGPTRTIYRYILIELNATSNRLNPYNWPVSSLGWSDPLDPLAIS